ncbi:hypothetical protein ABZ383_13445 [Streptomyces sp. NPDC005900]|uniref:hypothetical protein n=1 Tax=Streptomyces sp. NPDC005900 TaxID=3154569 RepID=UPI0033D67D10
MHSDTTPETGATGAGLSEAQVETEARRIIADAYRDTTPVAQPGRPPMSQGATDASVLLLTGGATTVMVGGTAGVLMYVSQFADPIVCGLVFGAPAAFVLALARLARRAKPDPEIHHHYEGPVHQDQRTLHSRTSGVWAKTTNEQ